MAVKPLRKKFASTIGSNGSCTLLKMSTPKYALCGESYYHAKTLDEIDSLLSSQHPVKERLAVEVVSL